MIMLQRRSRPPGVVAPEAIESAEPTGELARKLSSARAPNASGETAKATPAQRITLRRFMTLATGEAASAA